MKGKKYLGKGRQEIMRRIGKLSKIIKGKSEMTFPGKDFSVAYWMLNFVGRGRRIVDKMGWVPGKMMS